MACPPCSCDKYQKSAFSTVYLDVEFRHVECARCKSLYCNPMPESAMLQRMYGPSYESAVSERTNYSVEDPKEPDKCIAWLRRLGVGVFVDYGCGNGLLLQEAAEAGWHPVGVELDSTVARRVEERTGFRVL